MDRRTSRILASLLTIWVALTACAGVPESVVGRPEVKLQDVRVVGLGFNGQTFLLTFDVSNPNPYPLPICDVGYDLRLDGFRFASGQVAHEMTVPAAGVSQFAISVELDLLQTAPQLVSIVRDGVRRDIPYELRGQLALDLPVAPAVAFSHNGAIRVHSDGL